MSVCSAVDVDNRTTFFAEQDSFEDEYPDLGTCIALYPFDGE